MNADQLAARLREHFDLVHLEVEDQSDRHRHHREGAGGGHYQAVLVTAAFAGKSPMERHRLVYQALAGEMGTTIHALSLTTLTPAQWLAKQSEIGGQTP
ncbi:MAG TPA: BolA family transcriptional regulator [Cyanobacteria bacterium UBA8156]|jgi:BolA protein|nr:BolA family transcriptional regulator [Cyanobacteria bacterium UBA8156]